MMIQYIIVNLLFPVVKPSREFFAAFFIFGYICYSCQSPPGSPWAGFSHLLQFMQLRLIRGAPPSYFLFQLISEPLQKPPVPRVFHRNLPVVVEEPFIYLRRKLFRRHPLVYGHVQRMPALFTAVYQLDVEPSSVGVHPEFSRAHERHLPPAAAAAAQYRITSSLCIAHSVFSVELSAAGSLPDAPGYCILFFLSTFSFCNSDLQ